MAECRIRQALRPLPLPTRRRVEGPISIRSIMVGLAVGFAVEFAVGFTVRFTARLAVGLAVGFAVGLTVGFAMGFAVGVAVELAVVVDCQWCPLWLVRVRWPQKMQL